MTTTRDFETHPYSADEERIAAYLRDLLPDVGAGDDPIGFLIASHGALAADARRLAAEMREEVENRPLDDFAAPTCKQDVVDLLMRVQTGHCSCRRASDLLFPEFAKA